MFRFEGSGKIRTQQRNKERNFRNEKCLTIKLIDDNLKKAKLIKFAK